MLFGEHAVLHGRLAIVCAIDRRLRVTLKPRRDTTLRIASALGPLETDVRRPATDPRFRFALAAIERFRDRLDKGFDLEFESDFPPTIGFGSSAAATVATLAALHAWLGPRAAPPAIAAEGREVVRAVQGAGSGADVAASALGGVLACRAEPPATARLGHDLPLAAVYAGYKTPTPEVIARVEAARSANPPLYDALYDAIELVSQEASGALTSRDWPGLGRLMNVGHGLMEALGVSDARLAAIAHALRACPGVHGAKISGSGLGDCVVALGRPEKPPPGLEVMALDVAREGLRREARA